MSVSRMNECCLGFFNYNLTNSEKMFNAGTLKLANLVIGLELVFLCKECTCKPGVLSYMRKSNCEQKNPPGFIYGTSLSLHEQIPSKKNWNEQIP